mmetsp:Transcript_4115/g.8326  ORF Transcript_4115/g.8326 Transcript_4115/m.8326 type:complete len:95 (+) Transcript_4115:1275-1559(+)
MMQNTKAPRYVSRESMKRWMQTHPRAKLKYRQFSSSVSAHTAAALGDIEVLITLAQDDPKALEKQDENGWYVFAISWKIIMIPLVIVISTLLVI